MDTTTRSFRLAHAAGGDWETLTADCLAQIGEPPAGANLGFLYVTDSLDDDFARICERLRRGTGVAEWVGTIGFGVFVGGQEYFDVPAITVLVGAVAEDSFRILPTIEKPGEAPPAEVIAWAAAHEPVLGVVHADPRNANLAAIIHSITDDTGGFLVGGLTASRGAFHQLAGGLTAGGVSGVLFGGDVAVATGLTQGCSPIGEAHDVTEARDNVVIALDGRPALDVFKQDIGDVLARNLDRVGGYIHAALPIAGSDRPDYLVRNLIGIDPRQGWIALGERLSAGDRLMFVRRDGASAMADLDRMLGDISGRIGGTPRAALYYSCVARGPNLFGHNSEELTAVAEALGDVPLVGFFANGEISNNRVYGYTGVLTVIR